MTRSSVWRPAAQADPFALYDRIASQAGHGTALAWTDGLGAQARSLSEFAERGAPRDDLAPLARTIVYKRRTVIAYRVLGDVVEIVRLAHRGRDIGRMFDEED